MQLRRYLLAFAALGLLLLGLWWWIPANDRSSSSDTLGPGRKARKTLSSPPSFLNDSLTELSPLQRAAAVLLNPRRQRNVSPNDCIRYLNHFGWNGARLSACYYLTYDELFLHKLIELVDSDPIAALVVALEAEGRDQRIAAARSLQRLDPENGLGYLLEARLELAAESDDTIAADVMASALTKNRLSFYTVERSDPLVEVYRFLGLSSEDALAHSALYPQITTKPAMGIGDLAKRIAERSSEGPIEHATTQIHLSELLRSTMSREFANANINSLDFELMMNNAEINALSRVPPKTYYGEGDITVGERIDELKASGKELVDLHSAARIKLAAASDSTLSKFFGVWEASGYREAVDFIANH